MLACVPCELPGTEHDRELIICRPKFDWMELMRRVEVMRDVCIYKKEP
jgi:hypothetical protein